MTKIVVYLSIFLSLFFPLPVFFDFSKKEFLLVDTPFGHEALFPLPIGFLSLLICFFVFYVFSFITPRKFFSFLTRKESLFFLVFIFLLFVHCYLFVGLEFSRVVQLVIPVFFFSLVAVPSSVKVRSIFFNVSVFSMMIFVFLHFLSLALYNDSVFDISSYEFPMFFELSIYQSLVSYPAVLGLYFTLMIYIVFNGSAAISFKITLFIICYLLLTAARKAALFEMAFVLFVLVILAPILHPLKVKLATWLKGMLLVGVGVYGGWYLSENTPAVDRLIQSLSGGTFTGGRTEIFAKMFRIVENDLLGFLFGSGGGTYSFHNYILDLLYRVGFIFTVVYLVFLFFIFFKVYMIILSSGVTVRKWFFFCIIGQFLIQVMVNSPLTQPYYIVNFCFVLLYLMYFPNKKYGKQ